MIIAADFLMGPLCQLEHIIGIKATTSPRKKLNSTGSAIMHSISKKKIRFTHTHTHTHTFGVAFSRLRRKSGEKAEQTNNKVSSFAADTFAFPWSLL